MIDASFVNIGATGLQWWGLWLWKWEDRAGGDRRQGRWLNKKIASGLERWQNALESLVLPKYLQPSCKVLFQPEGTWADLLILTSNWPCHIHTDDRQSLTVTILSRICWIMTHTRGLPHAPKWLNEYPYSQLCVEFSLTAAQRLWRSVLSRTCEQKCYHRTYYDYFRKSQFVQFSTITEGLWPLRNMWQTPHI